MNAKKSKAILFSDKKVPSKIAGISMGGKKIETYPSIKHLGIILDSKLNWTEHIDYISKRANKAASSLFLLSPKLPSHVLLAAYKSYVRPILEYADIVWAGCNINLQNKLEQNQYRAMRAITGAIKTTDSNRLRHYLGLPKLSDRRHVHRLCLFYKITQNLSPNYLCKTLNKFKKKHVRNLRNNIEYEIPRTKNRKHINSFFIGTIPDWNKLSGSLKNNCKTPKNFKLKILKTLNVPYRSSCRFFHGNRNLEKILNRFMLLFTSLHFDLFTHNITETPLCDCGKEETREHYIFECTNFQYQRIDLNDILRQTPNFENVNFTTTKPRKILKHLHESLVNIHTPNQIVKRISTALQNYFEKTGRFDN